VLSQVPLTKQDHARAILSVHPAPSQHMTEGTLETIGENVCPMLQYGETSTLPLSEGDILHQSKLIPEVHKL
jgi:hypothetical protein